MTAAVVALVLAVCVDVRAKVPEPGGAGLITSRDGGALFLPDGSLLAPDSSRAWTVRSRDGTRQRWPGLPARSGATAMGATGFARDAEIAILTAGDTIERYTVAGERSGRVSVPIPDARAIAFVSGDAGDAPFHLAWSDRVLCAVDTAGVPLITWTAAGGDTITGVAWSPGRNGRLVAIAAGASVHLLHEDGSRVPGWPVSIDQPVVSAPLFPIWQAGAVLCADRLGRVFAWNFTGQLREGWPFETSTWNERVSLAAADWDGNGRDEIFVAASEGYWVATETGSAWPGTPVYSRSAAILDPLVFDIDADSTLELLGGTYAYGTFVLEPDGRVIPTPWNGEFVPLLAGFRAGAPVVAGTASGAWEVRALESGSGRPATPSPAPEAGWTARGGDPTRSNGRAAVRLKAPGIVIRATPGPEPCAGEDGRFEILVLNPRDRPISNAHLSLSGPDSPGFRIPIGSIPGFDSVAVRFRAPAPLAADSGQTFVWSVRAGTRRFPGAIDRAWRLEPNAPFALERVGAPGPPVEALEHHGGLLTRLAGTVITTTDRNGRVVDAFSTEGRAFAWRDQELYVLRGSELFLATPDGEERFVSSTGPGRSAEALFVLDSFYVFVDTSCAFGHDLELVSRRTGERRTLAIPPAHGIRGSENSLFARVAGPTGSRLVEWRLPGGQLSEWSAADEDVRSFSVSDQGLVLAVETAGTFAIRAGPHRGSGLETAVSGLEAAPVAVAISDSFLVWQSEEGTGSAWQAVGLYGGARCRFAFATTRSPMPLALSGSSVAFASDAPGFARTGSVVLPPADEGRRDLLRWRDPQIRKGAIVVAWEASGVEPEDRFRVVRLADGVREMLATIRAGGRQDFAIVDSNLPTHHAGLGPAYEIIWLRGFTPIDSLPALRVEVPRTIDSYALSVDGGNPTRSGLRLSVRIPDPGREALRVELFDLSGRRVASRGIDGSHAVVEVDFDAHVEPVPASGVYFARLVGERGVLDSRKIVLLR